MRRLFAVTACIAAIVVLVDRVGRGDGAESARVELFGTEYVGRDAPAASPVRGLEECAALAQDAAGRLVLAYQSRPHEASVVHELEAQRFDAFGRALGSAVQLNLTTRTPLSKPVVALDPAGGAWFAWESYGQDGSAGAIVARRLDPTLAHGTNEILVDPSFEGHQAEPTLAVDARGRAVIAWTSPGASGRSRVVLARRFDADGTPLGLVVRAGSLHDGRDQVPNVACEPDGGFALVWARTDVHGRPAGIFAQRFDEDTLPIGSELEVSPHDGGVHVEPALAVDARGALLAGWFTAQGESYAASVRRLTPVLGTAEAPASWTLSSVSTFAAEAESYASGLDLALRDDGSALAVWTSYGPAEREHGGEPEKKAEVLARELDRELVPASSVLHVAASERGAQRIEAAVGSRRLAIARDGRVACAWSGRAGAEEEEEEEEGEAEEHRAFVSVWTPASLDRAEVASLAAALPPLPAAEALQGAAPHVPPFFEPPPSTDPSAFLDPESVGGPDYGFMGITQTSLTPPDPHMAVGPNHVVVITNGRISFYNKSGGAPTFTDETDGPSGFWTSAGANGFIFDPEVLFDPHTNRFMAMLCERGNDGNPYFLFAVSDDANPNGTWFKYRFNVFSAINDTDIDSPNMAVDSQAIYLTADFFGPDKYLIFIVEKAPTLTGGVPITRSLSISGQQSIGIPVTYGTAPAQYMIESFEAASNTQMRFHAITDPLGSPARTTVTINVPTYEQPENPPQMGTTTRPETFESRFWSCVYRNGSLWATHHTGAARVRQRWYQFDMQNWPTSGTPTLVQSGDIDPGATVRTFFGSIGVDANDDVGLVFARSSPTEFISMSRAFRKASDPLGTMTTAVAMKTSTTPDTSGRWGDYSGTVPDPSAPGAFWGYHEYRTSGWTTWVGLMGPCDTPTTYCTAKVTSQGLSPSIGWTGEPSIGANNLHVTMTDGLAGKAAILFYGDTPGAVPFQGGIKCVLAPTHRTPLFTLDGSGAGDVAIPVPLADLGLERFFQFYFRDPTHPDGTGVGLSNALQLRFCP